MEAGSQGALKVGSISNHELNYQPQGPFCISKCHSVAVFYMPKVIFHLLD